jgi:hypothetical protein
MKSIIIFLIASQPISIIFVVFLHTLSIFFNLVNIV